MQPGDVICIRARKSDGTTYRTWSTTIESVERDCLVTINRAGDPVRDTGGSWVMKHAMRSVYWFGRPYNLGELYQDDGRLKQIYIHIASPASIEGGVLCYTDHELDVVKRPGQPLRIVDEDEFDEATSEYGYSPEFCSSCRQAVCEALDVASRWQVLGPPVFGRRARGPKRRSAWTAQEVRTETPAADSSTRSIEV